MTQLDTFNTPNVRAHEGIDESDKKSLMLDALRKTMGVVSPACELVGISRPTHYNWLKDDDSYASAVDAISQGRLDFAESKLHDLVDGVYVQDHKHGSEVFLCVPNDKGVLVPIEKHPRLVYKRPPCIKAIGLALKCQGKERGWTERHEITGADGAPVQTSVLSPEAAQAVSSKLDEAF